LKALGFGHVAHLVGSLRSLEQFVWIVAGFIHCKDD
jgi:hypothetical protein